MNTLTIAVILIAVAQALTILLTIGREREIKRLRDLVTEHRIQIAEVKAWLAGRMQGAQPRRIKSDREPTADDTRAPEPATTPKGLPDTVRPNPAEDEPERATKAFRWFKEDADEARAFGAVLKGSAPEPAITPKDLTPGIRPGATEDQLNRAAKADDWSREIVAGLQAGLQLQRGAPPVPATMPKDLPDAIRPGTAEDELKRATKAINWLNEDAEKARAVIAAQQVNRTGPLTPSEIHKADEADAEADPPSLRRKT